MQLRGCKAHFSITPRSFFRVLRGHEMPQHAAWPPGGPWGFTSPSRMVARKQLCMRCCGWPCLAVLNSVFGLAALAFILASTHCDVKRITGEQRGLQLFRPCGLLFATHTLLLGSFFCLCKGTQSDWQSGCTASRGGVPLPRACWAVIKALHQALRLAAPGVF